MKNKRIISLILALIMLLAVPVGVFAEEELTNLVTITFAAGEGTGTMKPVEVEKDTEYTLPENKFTAPDG
ncbi:YbbR domain-containing protein, partial [Peptoniphilus olsenii]